MPVRRGSVREPTGHYELHGTHVPGVLSVVWVDGTAEGVVMGVNERRVPLLAAALRAYMAGERWPAEPAEAGS